MLYMSVERCFHAESDQGVAERWATEREFACARMRACGRAGMRVRVFGSQMMQGIVDGFAVPVACAYK